jgi:hypothetical protein
MMGDENQQKGRAVRGRRIAVGAAAALMAAGAVASLAPSAFAAETTAQPAAVGWCQTADLTVTWQGAGNATQKHYANLIFTNTGAATCHLGGFPALTFVDASGTPIGLPATQIPADQQHFVTLAPGATTTAQARRVNAEVYDTDLCQIVTTAAISVLPPGNTTAILLPESATACTGDIGDSLLDVGPIGTSYEVED